MALTTPDGVIVDSDLFPANGDEREAAQELLAGRRGLCVLGDKGFLDQERQAALLAEQDVRLVTPKRKNQAKDAFGLERPGARSVGGLLSRVIAKLTGLTLAAQHNRAQGHAPLRLAEFAF